MWQRSQFMCEVSAGRCSAMKSSYWGRDSTAMQPRLPPQPRTASRLKHFEAFYNGRFLNHFFFSLLKQRIKLRGFLLIATALRNSCCLIIIFILGFLFAQNYLVLQVDLMIFTQGWKETSICALSFVIAHLIWEPLSSHSISWKKKKKKSLVIRVWRPGSKP